MYWSGTRNGNCEKRILLIGIRKKKGRKTMQETKVTVVIPNYNGIKYIRNCMDSLRRQTGEPFDILVIDNASADGSLEILEGEYQEARVIALEENTGFCHAVNLGIQESKTPYVILLNNDTVVKPDFVTSLVKAIEAREDIFSVSAQMLSMEDENILDGAGDGYNIFGWAYARGKGQPADKYTRKAEVFSACGGAAIYRKSIMEQIGYFDEKHFAYLEDVDIGYRARIYGYRNMYEPSAKVIHAGSAVSGSRYNAFKTQLASTNNAYVVVKNLPLLLLILNAPFLLLGFLVKACFFARKKMGMLYVKGYWKGIQRGFSKEGRKHHVPFKIKHIYNYVKLEVWKIWGIIGCLMKY